MYKPEPIDTSDIVLPEELLELTEKIADNVHDVWAVGRIKEGWKFGPVKDGEAKITPLLIPYGELPESEKEYDRNTALETVKLIIKLGYKVEKEPVKKSDIYISYRRDGGETLAQLLYKRLHDDGYKVFMDMENLRADKFADKLYKKIKKCNDFIILLMPRSLDRCQDESDWLRREIECALKEKKNIVPVMMPNFEYPNDLPESLRELLYFNGIAVKFEFFDAFIQKLEKHLLVSKV